MKGIKKKGGAKMFSEVFGEKIEGFYDVNLREAIRAVIIKGDKLLMIKTNRGDIKFPGGGKEKGESDEETLIREVREEAGYDVERIIEKMGTVTEQHFDKYEKEKIFKMVSTYYLCEVKEEKKLQKLDEYEKRLGFEAIEIDIDEAIERNEIVINEVGNEGWVFREWVVLQKLKDEYLVNKV
ncbi:NUDIX domain-containing protein [uncultured Clostridium sp.]|uniref:NUDIX hydrolase n=1 Tax=uncultured Clostridium sp. TaxID=59620 RepID=UPI00261D49F3|nr:NUDIX domain-containing protein [uncultured Clostridium sp.]